MADPQRPLLEFIATEIDQMAGRYSPGREVYYALMRARRAVQEAARQVTAEDERVWPAARMLPILGTVGDGGRIASRNEPAGAKTGAAI